ncbi:hypothetical protein [Dethiobacter alkaliphilus]|uniref:hypothetical protein n=1 Tax=Dethiobacter alkaliphilus TaxID=427926 RepID=UPI002226F115|nr:hypothetical protein [Dethiobacter alkaliphilus]MCW3489731.1 hypothetical protein [Dethiobacter alkaliphilus]
MTRESTGVNPSMSVIFRVCKLLQQFALILAIYGILTGQFGIIAYVVLLLGAVNLLEMPKKSGVSNKFSNLIAGLSILFAASFIIMFFVSRMTF